MANERYERALERVIERFKGDFFTFSRAQFTNAAGKLSHPSEFGGSREKICRELLLNILPRDKSIETRGFIINAQNETSPEQDIVIFSESHTPLLTVDTDKFFPIETVVGVGQVKSVIKSKTELKEVLDGLVNIKRMRQNMGHQSIAFNTDRARQSGYRKDDVHDQICTFLICEKISFPITPEEIDAMYQDATPQHLKHNLLCDLTNGIFAYRRTLHEPLVGIPLLPGENSAQPAYIPSTKNQVHIKHFLTNLQILIPGATIFHADMGVYLKK